MAAWSNPTAMHHLLDFSKALKSEREHMDTMNTATGPHDQARDQNSVSRRIRRLASATNAIGVCDYHGYLFPSLADPADLALAEFDDNYQPCDADALWRAIADALRPEDPGIDESLARAADVEVRAYMDRASGRTYWTIGNDPDNASWMYAPLDLVTGCPPMSILEFSHLVFEVIVASRRPDVMAQLRL